MQTIQWESKFETGQHDMDLQHQYFLNLINHFIKAMQQNKKKVVIEAMVHELTAYARFHFSSEERLMIENEYPGYQEHKMQHMDLIQTLNIQINNIDKDFEKGMMDITNFLVNWFVHHTTEVDKKFTHYLEHL